MLLEIEEADLILLDHLVPWFRRRRRHRKLRLAFQFKCGNNTVQGEFMDFTMPPLDSAGKHSTVSVIGHAVKAPNTPSKATLSASEYSSSDATIFTVDPDPATPGGAIITAVATPAESESVQGVLTEKATATEPDGTTTEQVMGTANIIIATPAAPASGIEFVFGSPQ